MNRSPVPSPSRRTHRKSSLRSRLAFFAAGFWLCGPFWLLGDPAGTVCRAEGPPAAFEQLQRRWPNGPFQDHRQFPIAVWLQNPRNAGRYKEIGITLYVGLWKGPTESEDRLRKPPGANGLPELGENRSLPIQNGTFRDRFGPYEVHLYEIALRAAPTAHCPATKADGNKPESASSRKGENLPPLDGSENLPRSGMSAADRSEPEKPAPPDKPPALPPVEFHPEMSYAIEPNGWILPREWTNDQKSQAVKAQKEAQALWQKLAPQYAQWVTPEKVRELSRWAQSQMAHYRAVPPLERSVLEPVGLSSDGRILALEGVIDTLPSHHRLVTRWLKVYVHYDLSAKKIVQVVFTIRGQLKE